MSTPSKDSGAPDLLDWEALGAPHGGVQWLELPANSKISLTGHFTGAHHDPEPRDFVIDVPRTWTERLFSRPWRPHHNVRRFETKGRVSGDEDAGYYTIHPIGKITETTART